MKVDLKYILNIFEEYNVPTGIANYMSKTKQLNDIPKGIRIFGRSKGIKVPTTKKMKYEDAIEEIKNTTDFSEEKTIVVKSCANDYLINSHKTEIYKKK